MGNGENYFGFAILDCRKLTYRTLTQAWFQPLIGYVYCSIDITHDRLNMAKVQSIYSVMNIPKSKMLLTHKMTTANGMEYSQQNELLSSDRPYPPFPSPPPSPSPQPNPKALIHSLLKQLDQDLTQLETQYRNSQPTLPQ
jgi:hypothetical protein